MVEYINSLCPISGAYIHSEVNNLVSIPWKSEDDVIQCLENRFLLGHYYTWAGIALIAVNPCKEIHYLYSDEVKELYNNTKKSGHEEELLPHAYAIATCARYKLLHSIETTDQVIIISGDSGSGKTYTAWHLLNFLAAKGCCESDVTRESETLWQICCSVPVLSAFGNAQTKCNENSSRFGKLLQLQYRSGCIVGAYIQTYLLEKTRVASQPANERNFHIFHQILAGLSIDYLAELYLYPNIKFKIVPGSKIQADEHGYRETMQSLTELGITSNISHKVFQVLACILHLGNLDFIQSQNADIYVLDLETEASSISFEAACMLLGLTVEALQGLLTCTLIVARSSGHLRPTIYNKPSTSAQECHRRRDCLMRFLYEGLFKWIVAHINTRVSSNITSAVLGILDIYGFESFDNNSLEQLCINYANERLQYHFIKDFMNQQKDMMQDEGTNIHMICYEESYDRVKLLDAPISVFSILNEECLLQRVSNGTTICQKLASNLNTNKYLVMTIYDNTSEFIIKHYAGDVCYNTQQMLEKNSDKVPQEMYNILKISTNSFISKLIEVEETDKILKIRKNTLLTKFKNSVDDLCKTLEKADTQYIRCVKANPEFLPEVIDTSFFKKQLQASGILEAIPLCKTYFPIRLKYDEFEDRYGSLLEMFPRKSQKCENRKDNDFKDISPAKCKRASCIINKIFPSDVLDKHTRFGQYTMFITESALLKLEEWRRKSRMDTSKLILRVWKEYHQHQTSAAIKIQRFMRCQMLKKHKTVEMVNYSTNELTPSKLTSTENSTSVKDLCNGDTSEATKQGNSTLVDISKLKGSGDTFQQENNNKKTPEILNKCDNTTTMVSKKLFDSIYFGDGIVSKRSLIKIPLRLHTKTTCLAYSYVLPFSALPRGLEDAIC